MEVTEDSIQLGICRADDLLLHNIKNVNNVELTVCVLDHTNTQPSYNEKISCSHAVSETGLRYIWFGFGKSLLKIFESDSKVVELLKASKLTN